MGNSNILESAHNRGNSFKDLSLMIQNVLKINHKERDNLLTLAEESSQFESISKAVEGRKVY